MDVSLLVVVVVTTALVFDFTNGFHDAANAMATTIATGALSPRIAVALSAVLNLIGAFLSVEVAKTISGGMVDDAAIGPEVIFGGLIGAIIWNLLTWYVGLPSSSSHALFGGLIGAAWVAAGTGAIHFDKIVEKVLLPAIASPVLAGLVAMIATYLVYRLVRRRRSRGRSAGFRAGQILSASLVSLAHGTNDAQKTMGVITLTLVTTGMLPTGAAPPLWVIVSAALAIALGTYLGGWRIIYTMGKGLTDLEGPQGFAAQTSSASVILVSSQLGLPLSTTHVCSGGVIGSGLGRREAPVRWRVAGRMCVAWLITLPSAAVVGAIASMITSTGTVGTVAVAIVGLAVGGGLYLASRRRPVGPRHAAASSDGESDSEPSRVAA
ncbi:PiT family inorganic phosphate transporter [Tamaricihabitans halophyticus]|uniref:Phosphate transporter n=1 Tax=Tamaricihabitans halophyticus TaxID=1262583 RepID=A0A4V2SRR4_9PSEU|nr:inorganic phosphate transporter [Tamaricihabitans halophyticus]TCP43606.1 PiT family inorganic phosphate transporter [Tamaricihabitans halophyticus]